MQIFEVMKIHKDFLESTITSSGGEQVRTCNYELCIYWFCFVISPESNTVYLVATATSMDLSTRVQL